jgi:hypothetical protein
MVENKEESLARARERGVQLELNNVWFYQSNMDYYQVIAGATKSGSTSPMDYYQVKAGAQQCIILPVQHRLLSGNSWGSTMSNYQFNMDYYQVIAGAQQCLRLPV